MLRLFTALCVLLAWGASVHADPLDRRNLPANAVWFVHLDLDAAHESSLGRLLRDLLLSRPESSRAIEQARQILGIDLTREVQSITVYGATFAPDAGVVLARGKVDREKIQTLLKTLPDYHSEMVAGHWLYFWTEADPNRHHECAGAFFGDDRIVIAPHGPQVIAALETLEGKTDSLSQHSALGSQIVRGAILQTAAAGLSQARELPIESPIVRQCESGSLSLSEENGVVSVSGRVVTKSPDTAAQLYKLIEGAQALGQLQAPENSDLANLLHPLVVSIKDKTVGIDWRYSATDLVKIIIKQESRKIAATQPEKQP